jgi:hypothetical protein
VVNPDAPEVLDLGPVDATDTATPAGEGMASEQRHPASRRGVLTLAGLGVAGGVGLSVRNRGSPPTARAAPLPAPTVTAPVAPDDDAQASAPVVVSELGGPLLGGPRVDVFGLGAGGVIRVELATGRMTRTQLPPMPGGNVSFVPVRDAVLVHVGDFGPVYVVPDGRLPQVAPAGLAGIGPLLPGPDPDHVWVVRGPGSPAYLVLLDVRGEPTGTVAPLPAFGTTKPIADRTGFSLAKGVGGTYWAGPPGLRRVTTGAVVATGPTGWLVVECDDRDTCSGVLVTRGGGRRPVDGVLEPSPPVGDLSVPFGALSPDGRSAAFYAQDRVRGRRLVVLDLVTGRRRRTALNLVDGPGPGRLAWTPDGRWLLAVDSSARILALDPATGGAAPLVPDTVVPAIPVVQEVAIRSYGAL